jgi:hypothetical protein
MCFDTFKKQKNWYIHDLQHILGCQAAQAMMGTAKFSKLQGCLTKKEN